MTLPLSRAGGASNTDLLTRLPTDNGDPATIATNLIARAGTPTGVDLAKIHADIADIAASDPVLARATHDEVAAKLDPSDAGQFLSGIFDKIGDAIRWILESGTHGTNGQPATTGPQLATPADPSSAPTSINFPRTAQAGFDKQWADSFPGGSAMEQGGTLFYDKESGQIVMLNVGGHGSTPGTFTPDYTNPDPSRYQLLGVFHTHPYDSGDTGISFSGADVAVMINEGHNLIMAQSGDRQFVMMRTDQTPANVDYTALNNAQNARISELVSEGMSFADASSQAASELATEYHLAYYEGSNGNLTRINP